MIVPYVKLENLAYIKTEPFKQSGNPVYVDKVCNHGKEFCWLNGCGDEVMNVIKTRIAPWLGFVAIFSVILYVYGMIFTFMLTKEVKSKIAEHLAQAYFSTFS